MFVEGGAARACGSSDNSRNPEAPLSQQKLAQQPQTKNPKAKALSQEPETNNLTLETFLAGLPVQPPLFMVIELPIVVACLIVDWKRTRKP